MIEKAARAMYEQAGLSYHPNDRTWDDEAPECKAVWLEHAKAALLSVREPSDGIQAVAVYDEYDWAGKNFTAMIDAILNEQPAQSVTHQTGD